MSWDTLEPNDKARISLMLCMIFRYFENMFHQNRKGSVFSEPFVEFPESADAVAIVPSYHDVTHQQEPS